MTLKTGTASGGGSLGTKIAPAVYGKMGVIKKITQSKTEELGDYKPDLFVKFIIDAGGDFDEEVDFFGSFKRDDISGEITDWGGAFTIDKVFKDINGYEGLSEEQMSLTDDFLMPDFVIDNCIGKKVIYLLYGAGKNRNKDKMVWTTFPALSEAQETAEQNTAIYNSLLDELMSNDYHSKRLIKGRDYLDKDASKTTSGSSSSSSDRDDIPF